MTTTKVRTLKNGTIKTYQYETNKEYNDKYYNENKTKILKKIYVMFVGVHIIYLIK